MIPLIYDDNENKGVNLVFDFENGMSISVFLDDSNAQNMIDIIQNKLNGRF